MNTPSIEEYQPFPDIARRNWTQETIEVPLLVRLLSLPQGERILEVGCGRGVALPVFARMLQPLQLVGLDIDGDALAVAEERLHSGMVRAELYQADVRSLPFEDGAFDMVIDFGTCHHIPRAADALREIERVLATGGLFICESVTSQLLSHPFRTRGRRLPWPVAPRLRVERDAVLWKSRRKVA